MSKCVCIVRVCMCVYVPFHEVPSAILMGIVLNI